jgi:hypothetical protein
VASNGIKNPATLKTVPGGSRTVFSSICKAPASCGKSARGGHYSKAAGAHAGHAGVVLGKKCEEKANKSARGGKLADNGLAFSHVEKAVYERCLVSFASLKSSQVC